MIKSYKISVIVPVYNVEDYIKETLNSLMNQTIKDFEVIMVNDGSTDNSVEIIKSYMKKYENIVLINQENGGPSKARNRGIAEANGEFIVFMDSDDLIPKDSLEVRYDLAKKNEADVVICGTYKYDGKEKWPMKKHFLKEGIKDVKKDYDLLWTVGPCNKIFRRNLIKGIRFPEDIKYAEDQVFVMTAYIKAKRIYATQYVGYYYRMRNNPTESLTQQIQTNSADVISQVLKSWTLTEQEIDSNINDKIVASNLKNKYFYRLTNIDIWPPFRLAILSNQKDIATTALRNLNELLNNVGIDQLNSIGKIKRIVFKNIVRNNKVLSESNKIIVIKFIIKVHNLIIKAKKIIKG